MRSTEDILNEVGIVFDVRARQNQSGFTQADRRDERKGSKNAWYRVTDNGVAWGFWNDGTTGFEFFNDLNDTKENRAKEMLQVKRSVTKDYSQSAKKASAVYDGAKAYAEWYADSKKHHHYVVAKGLEDQDLSGIKIASIRKYVLIGDEWQEVHFKDVLIVPIFDSEQRLINIQQISDAFIEVLDRNKDFIAGGQKAGGRMVIQGTGNSIVLCEGWATAQTIHHATGLTCVVCFDAGNLVKVAASYKHIRGVVVAADNDWEREQEGRVNAGLKFGMEAAKACLGKMVYPDLKGRAGSDFNDLYAYDGIEAVHDSFLPPKPIPKKYPVKDLGEIVILGYGDERCHVMTKRTMIYQAITKKDLYHKSTIMTMLSPREWMSLSRHSDGIPLVNETNFQIKVDECATFIFNQCIESKFTAYRVVKLGARMTDAGIVFSHGNGYILKGKDNSIGYNIDTGLLFLQSNDKIVSIKDPCKTSDGDKLLTFIDSLNWKKSTSSMLLTGWLVVAPIAGALSWRPHVWVTGEAGSGKSWVLNHIVKRVLGNCQVSVGSDSTKAGLAGTLSDYILPVIFDEAEAKDDSSRARMIGVMELMRSSSVKDGGMSLKGTPNGDSRSSEVNSAFCFSSINPVITEQSDAGRITVLELNKNTDSDSFDEIKREHANLMTDEFCQSIVSRSIIMADKISTAVDVFKNEFGNYVDQRDADQYGTLCAGYWMLTHDALPTPSDAKNVFASMGFGDGVNAIKNASASKNDSLDCFEHLMSTEFRFTDAHGFSKMVTLQSIIGYMLVPRHMDSCQDALADAGMSFNGTILTLLNTNGSVRRAFNKTKHGGTFMNVLERFKHAKKGIGTKRIGMVTGDFIEINIQDYLNDI